MLHTLCTAIVATTLITAAIAAPSASIETRTSIAATPNIERFGAEAINNVVDYGFALITADPVPLPTAKPDRTGCPKMPAGHTSANWPEPLMPTPSLLDNSMPAVISTFQR